MIMLFRNAPLPSEAPSTAADAQARRRLPPGLVTQPCALCETERAENELVATAFGLVCHPFCEALR